MNTNRYEIVDFIKNLTGYEILSKKGIDAYQKASDYLESYKKTGYRVYLADSIIGLTKDCYQINSDEDKDFILHSLKMALYRQIVDNVTEKRDEEIYLFEKLVVAYREIVNENLDYEYNEYGEKIYDTTNRYRLLNRCRKASNE